MWRFTKSNAITEGLHNKMEVISRRAYGFRNFQNYRLRVRAPLRIDLTRSVRHFKMRPAPAFGEEPTV
jgi:hypothetical protein